MQKGFAPILVLLGIALVLSIAGGAYYLGTQQKKEFPLESISNDSKKESPSPTSSGISENLLQEATPQDKVLNAPAQKPTRDPKIYGFTKLIDLPVIGIRAKFSEDSKHSLAGDAHYNIGVGPDNVAIQLENYSGGGRRAWFQKNHGSFADTFETFSTNEHSGYLAYLKNGIDKNNKGIFFYFTVIGSDKMLLVQGYNSKEGNRYFGGDLDKFKSFLSTIEFTTITKSPNSQIKTSDLFRWSDSRKVLWQDESLGLKITGPDWIDYRNTNGRNVDGSWNFSDWNRRYLVANTYQSIFYGRKVTNISIQIGYGSPSFLNTFDEDYKNKDFNDVVYNLLLPAGFCANEWKSSKDKCERTEYCYTKEEVTQDLRLKKSQKIGSLDAQLRSIDEKFNAQMDCRSIDTWLIKAKNGQFVVTEIYPDGEAVRIEAF